MLTGMTTHLAAYADISCHELGNCHKNQLECLHTMEWRMMRWSRSASAIASSISAVAISESPTRHATAACKSMHPRQQNCHPTTLLFASRIVQFNAGPALLLNNPPKTCSQHSVTPATSFKLATSSSVDCVHNSRHPSQHLSRCAIKNFQARPATAAHEPKTQPRSGALTSISCMKNTSTNETLQDLLLTFAQHFVLVSSLNLM